MFLFDQFDDDDGNSVQQGRGDDIEIDLKFSFARYCSHARYDRITGQAEA